MADTLEKQANAAFIDEDYERAVELFTEAFAADPKNASLLVSRAQAHIKLENYTDAVSDATKAIELDPSLSKAYLRKGVACFSLEEYETAKAAFLAALEHEPSNSQYKNWIKKCNAALAEEAANDQAHLKEDALPSESPRLNELNGLQTNANFHSDSKVSASQAEMVAEPQTKPAPKYRHDFYENANEVVVEIFAKGLKPDNLKIDFGVQSLSVVISVPPDPSYVFNTRLNQKIVIEKCKYNILGTKVEIRLAKAEMLHWKTLEYNQSQIAVQAKPIPSAATETKAYPSSSKKGHKDWDKLEAQVKKEEKDEKLEGDAALNKLFRDIYQNADEDTRRAMNKSFVESNGTVLSTNWKEVGSKHVDGSPPSGMEMKKWEV